MTDILLGAADTYNSDQLRPWIQSARDSGFDGHIWIIVYRKGPQWDSTLFNQYKVGLYEVTRDAYNNEIEYQIQNSPTCVHNLRMYHFWELLTRLDRRDIEHCICTDISDVIFQRNPSEWLRTHLYGGKERGGAFVAGSESIRYAREEWGYTNMIKGYGLLNWELQAKEWQIYNVGTLGGDIEVMMHLCGTIYRMTENRYYPSDQSSLNMLIRGAFEDHFTPAFEKMAWAANLGTTDDPTKQWLWARCNEPRPTITPEGRVLNSEGEEYFLVHQYNRVPELKKIIEEKYAGNSQLSVL